MHPRDMALLGLPLAMLVLLIGGVWHGVLDSAFRESTEEAWGRDTEGEPFDDAEYNRGYEATQVPVKVSFWTALPLAVAGIVGLHAHWSGPRPHAWLQARATLLWPLASILGVTALLGVLRVLDPEALAPFQAATALLLPAAALFWSLLAGYWIAHRSKTSSRRIRTGLAWTTAAALVCALLMVVVLIPDPTSEDLAFFAVPALALSGLLAICFMAMGMDRATGPADAVRDAATTHDKP